MAQRNLICPQSMLMHIVSILKGEYNIDFTCASPIILDIGANIGAFSVWASQKWANSQIYAYEPIVGNFELLKINTKGLNVISYNIAVKNDTALKGVMYHGLHNTGEASFHNLGEQNLESREEVNIINANTLPLADIVKIDTEGCEVEILRGLNLINAKVIMLEAHSWDDVQQICQILGDFSIVSLMQILRQRWLIKFIKGHLSINGVEIEISKSG